MGKSKVGRRKPLGVMPELSQTRTNGYAPPSKADPARRSEDKTIGPIAPLHHPHLGTPSDPVGMMRWVRGVTTGTRPKIQPIAPKPSSNTFTSDKPEGDRALTSKQRSLIAITLLVSVVTILVQGNGLLRSINWLLLDQYFSLRPLEPFDPRIVLVTIAEEDITYAQDWPMSDTLLVQALDQIQSQSPRLIGVDIYRNLPVEPGHDLLRERWQQWDNVLGIEKVAGEPIEPPPVLIDKGQVAASDLLLDRDGKIRRALILTGRPDNSIVLGLGADLALRYLAQEGIELQEVNPDRSIYGLGKATFVPLGPNDSPYGPEDMGGYQVLLRYRGNLDRFAQISLREVWQGQVEPDFFRDRIVLIGAIAPSLNDNHATPYHNSLFRPPALMPGVVIHANLASQMISAALDDRPQLRPLNPYLTLLWTIVMIWASVAFGLRYTQQPWTTWGSLLTLWGATVGVSYGSFSLGWVLPLAAPSFGILLGGGSSIITTLWINLRLSYRTLTNQHQQLQKINQDLQQLNRIYRCFVPLEYLQLLDKENILDIRLGDHVSRSMAISFSDIRKFTNICEDLTPQEAFDFVNDYLQRVSPEIVNHSGVIVKFMGDAIMAVFPRSADDAIAASLAQYRQLQAYNRDRQRQGYEALKIGTGVHLGRVMVGIIGEPGRMQGDVLSDAVNIAARLESLTKVYGAALLVSGDLIAHLDDLANYNFRLLDEVMVKGKTEPVALFEILDPVIDEQAELKIETRLLFEQGWFYYRSQQFIQARQRFYQVLQHNPNDAAAKLYLSRLHQFQLDGPPSEWNGVWQFTEK